jgi:3'(2'), 5'-bisphosphate nucleotidase
MPLTVTPEQMAAIVDIAKQAGREIMKVYETDFAVETKADSSPLTLADKAADALIVAALQGDAGLGHPIISEETFEEGATDAEPASAFWLVDPLDGTKQFVAKRGEFTVNIALVEAGRPVMGVVHAPAIGATYWGSPLGAFAETDGEPPRAIQTRPAPDRGLAAMVSRSHRTAETDAFLEHFTIADEVTSGSSIKFCRVAEGTADIYPRFGRTMEWDTAAAHAVLTHAGGAVLVKGGGDLTYGKPGSDNPDFVACSGAVADAVRAAFS